MTHEAPPFFSIVIPTYNHGQYLGRALQSVLDQTYANWEAIVIDNHSTDNTDDVMHGFTDLRISYVKIHNNGVIAVSRNVGIQKAKGEWIAFLDSDDWWSNDKLMTCYSTIGSKIDLIYHDLDIVSHAPRLFFKKSLKGRKLKSPVLIDLLVGGNAISNSSVVVRKKLLDDINGIKESRELIAAEDYNTWLRIARSTDHFIYLPQILGYYFVHDEAISKKDMSIPAHHAVSEFLDILDFRQKRIVESRIRYTKGRFNYLSGKTSFANKDLIYSLRYGSMLLKIKSLIMLILPYSK